MTDLVLTPGGFKPQDLVIRVPTQHSIRMRGSVADLVRGDGQLLRTVGEIALKPGGAPLMPRNLSTLRPVGRVLNVSLARLGGSQLEATPRAATVAPFATVDGWICNTGWTNGSGKPISRFATTWTVPPEPANKGSQTIFLFNGIQNSTMIYQPVLQWGSSAAGGGKRWSVASWYADGQTGVSFHTDLVDVAVGQELVGVMTLTGSSNGKFDYKCEFVGLANTTLPISQVEELTWANETLEAYGITSCDDYPAVSKTVFRNIALQTGTATPGLSWGVDDRHTECGSHCKVVSNSTTNGTVEAWYRGEIGVGGWVARHGLTAEQYQATFDDLVNNQGMTLVNVSGYQEGGQARYAAIWRKIANGPAWVARHGLSSAAHQLLFADLPAKGFVPVMVNGYSVAGVDNYASIWTKPANPPAWVARHGLSSGDYQKAVDEFKGQGFTPVWVSGFGSSGAERYATVWHKLPGPQTWQARHGLSATDYQHFVDQSKAQGLHPRVVSGYGVQGADRYAAIYDKPSAAPGWATRHGLNAAQYQQLFTDLPKQAMHPVQVCGYDLGGQVRFTSTWET